MEGGRCASVVSTYYVVSPINSVFGSTLLETEISSITRHNVGGAANVRGNLEGTTRSWQGLIARYHTCRSVPRGFTRNPRPASTTSAYNTHHQSHMHVHVRPIRNRSRNQKAERRMHTAYSLLFHLKNSDGGTPVTCSYLIHGRNAELIRTKREMYSHRRNQTHRQIPREIEAGVPENRSPRKNTH